MSGVTSETTTVRRHRADLAGGIRATVQRACYGATLSLDDGLRRLTLTLTPEQVREMAGWRSPLRRPSWAEAAMPAWQDCVCFCGTTRWRLRGLEEDERDEARADLAALAALAAAVLPEVGGDDE